MDPSQLILVFSSDVQDASRQGMMPAQPDTFQDRPGRAGREQAKHWVQWCPVLVSRCGGCGRWTQEEGCGSRKCGSELHFQHVEGVCHVSDAVFFRCLHTYPEESEGRTGAHSILQVLLTFIMNN